LIVDIHAHLWQTSISGQRYFTDEALNGWASNFAVGGTSESMTTPSGARVAVDADGSMLIEALDLAEQVLGEHYHICGFAIDLRPLFAMEVSVAKLNDWVMEQAARDPHGRIHPFACVNPTLPGAVEEVYRASAAGAEGFKLYPPTGFLPDDEAVDPFYQAVLDMQDRLGRTLPVLIHTGCSYSGSKYARPIHLQEVAFRYPDLRLIGAHVGSPWTDEAIWTAGIQKNIYLDIAAFGDLAGWWPQLLAEALGKAKRVGALGRMLYGSDWPLSAFWLPPDDEGPSWRNLHEVAKAVRRLEMPNALVELGYPTLTESELAGVLGKNAECLLNIKDRRDS
jgi:predicted TIM-barrel fold metal-dependent hydrolase